MQNGHHNHMLSCDIAASKKQEFWHQKNLSRYIFLLFQGGKFLPKAPPAEFSLRLVSQKRVLYLSLDTDKGVDCYE